ncbi:MAG: SIR2 family protein [Desulfarculaceae bacterium]|nr:SIR2 family protein [Desulfarculaceae bacterium]MCF8122763.1 SIR2 family protein [Desulfarculaceae bacterium]
MLDPLISLSFSIYSSKGVYALLLGSGTSRAAGVPTGWEIILDLIEKIAHQLGEDCEGNPTDWYTEKYGKEPIYGDLLKELAKTPAERRDLLRSYFEPTDDEREQGVKLPTKAHNAIADLIINGYVKVVITTNFDRLLEHALQQRGLQPTVISTPDGASGAIPLAHSDCTILKVNGDYLDERIKNAPNELSNYARPIASLLKRIFDEYGLIVCGWSADWDHALRAAIERHSGRRFSTYWAIRNKKSDIASKTIKLINAEPINISDANSFFTDIKENINSLEEFERPHPLSTKIAVNSLKRYIQSEQTIRLHDLVMSASGQSIGELLKDKYSYNMPIDSELAIKRIRTYENDIEVLLNLMAYGFFWAKTEHLSILTPQIQRIANAIERGDGFRDWITLRRYPALLLFYAAGVSSIWSNNFRNLHLIFENIMIRENEKEVPSYMVLNNHKILAHTSQRNLAGIGGHITPLSDHINVLLKDLFSQIIPEEYEFDKCFDIMEYLIALCFLDHTLHTSRGDPMVWAPFGRFGWRNIEYDRWTAQKYFVENINKHGNEFAPLKAGFFDGNASKLTETMDKLQDFLTRVGNQQGWF